MCFLLYKPANVTIKPEWVKNAYDSNGDGFGLSYKLNNELFILKGLLTVEQCQDACAAIPLEASALIHFRWATKGSVCDNNCHPFVIGDATCAHNGMLFGWGKDDMTDSEHFMQSHQLDKLSDQEIPRIEALIGSGKMVLLRPNYPDLILNEKLGSWIDGCWHSNNSSQASSWPVSDVDFPDVEESIPAFDHRITNLMNALEEAIPFLGNESRDAERLLQKLYENV
jgi:hypothetical protein